MRRDDHVTELDGVRGIACLSVVVWHGIFNITTWDLFSGGPTLHQAMVWMAGGVDLFFVLSGFLIGGILLDNRAASNFFRAFWLRRVARIFPVYILLLITYVGALALRPHVDAPWLDEWLLFSPLPLIGYLTFTQNFVMAFTGDSGAFWVGITWSLAVEEQFYLLFPGIVYALKRRSLVSLALACILGAFVVRIWLGRIGDPHHSMHFPTPARIDALMFGVLVACVVRSEQALDLARRFRRLLDALAIVAVAVLVDGRIPAAAPTVLFSLAAAVFAYGILRIFLVGDGPYRAVLRNPLLVAAGLISYAWYMYHQAVNGLVHGFLFGHAPIVSTYAELAAAGIVLGVSAGLAALSTRYFERPFRALARRTPYRFEPTAAPAPVPARS